jgi:hypothetical protein
MLALSERWHSLPKGVCPRHVSALAHSIDLGIECLALKPFGEVALALLYEHVDALEFQPVDYWDVMKLGKTQLLMLAEVELVLRKAQTKRRHGRRADEIEPKSWDGPTKRYGFVRRS